MTTTLSRFIHSEVFDLGMKLSGMAHLIGEYKPFGTTGREPEQFAGVGSLIEDLSLRAHHLAELIDAAEKVDPQTEVKFAKYERYPIGEVISQVRALDKSTSR